MGGAPSRETLLRHIVRDPRTEYMTATETTSRLGANVDKGSDATASSSGPQQPEIILIPLIPDYFPSSSSPLFQQLLHVRREPNVSYYYRDARSTATEHTVVRDDIGSDKVLYNWYMSLSEQRLMETDNELIALSRAGRVISPVPCAVAFVYNANATPLTAAATAAPSESRGGKRGSTAGGRGNRRGKPSGNNTGASNGFMTIENTARLPHHNLRVRIFGFVGDTRFCPPSMLPHQAAKSPMCLTIFLSKSAGGNHRAQVTLLAAHTYISHLQRIGILDRLHADSIAANSPSSSAIASAMVTAGMIGEGCGLRMPHSASSQMSIGAGMTNEADPLAALRVGNPDMSGPAQVGAGDPYQDPYADLYDDGNDAPDPYTDADEQRQQTPLTTIPIHSSNGLLDGLIGGCRAATAVELANEMVLRRPVEVVVHRADVPALCYLRELRARMEEEAPSLPKAAAGDAVRGRSQEMNAAAGAGASGKSGQDDSAPSAPSVEEAALLAHQSLKYAIHTVIEEEELRGTVYAETMGRVLLWASRFYGRNFELLVGGEAAKLRQTLAQRNLTENPLDGTLWLTEEEPRQPKTIAVPGDIWITPHDAYLERPRQDQMRQDSESWETVGAGTVLRYQANAASTKTVAAVASASGLWAVSRSEFAEDILLSLCRNACHISRRAGPADPHWLINRNTGLPEGLAVGLLIWREPAAGQVVFYGTTPDFLKKWVQSGAEVETAYRTQIKKVAAEEATCSARALADGTAFGGRVYGGLSDSGGHGPQSIAMAVPTAVSSGLHSSYDPNTLGDPGKGSGGSKEHSKGSGSSSMALYSVHTGFVSTPELDGSKPLSTKSDASSPSGKAPGQDKEGAIGSIAGGRSTKVVPLSADELARNAASTATVEMPMTSTTTGGTIRSSLAGSVTRYDEHRLDRSLPTEHRSQFAVPVVSSSSISRTSCSGSIGTPRSYSDLLYAESEGRRRGTLHGSLHTSSPHTRQAQQQQQPPSMSRHLSNAMLANTCWIGVPDPDSQDESNTPTVNVVVKQRRSFRHTPAASMLDRATGECHTPTRSDMFHRGSPHRSQTGSSARGGGGGGGVFFVSAAQPVRRASAIDTMRGTSPVSLPQSVGSLPIHIAGLRDASSEEESLRHGGHSPTSQEASRSLLKTSDTLLDNPLASTGATPRSSAMHIPNPRGVPPVGTPVEATSLKWTTTIAALPSSMRGASVTFTSGSARHGSLLHSGHYVEPCQPVPSRIGSMPTAGLADTPSAPLSSSFSYRKETLRPPSLFADVDGVTEPPAARSRTTEPLVAGHALMRSAPALIMRPREAGSTTHSRTSSAAHTPRQDSGVDSAKSSAGSGKYRWDWRGVSWTT